MPGESDWLQGCQMILALHRLMLFCIDFVPILIKAMNDVFFVKNVSGFFWLKGTCSHLPENNSESWAQTGVSLQKKEFNFFISWHTKDCQAGQVDQIQRTEYIEKQRIQKAKNPNKVSNLNTLVDLW